MQIKRIVPLVAHYNWMTHADVHWFDEHTDGYIQRDVEVPSYVTEDLLIVLEAAEDTAFGHSRMTEDGHEEEAARIYDAIKHIREAFELNEEEV